MEKKKRPGKDIDVAIYSDTTSFLNYTKEYALRIRAENKAREIITRMPEDLESLSHEEIRKAFFELRVHQIELEMQNKELWQSQADLETERARYFDLYELAPVGYCILSEKGLILETNLTATTMLGVPQGELIDQPINRFILAEYQDTFYLLRHQIAEAHNPKACELRMVKQDGVTTFWVQLAIAATQYKDEAPVYRVVMSDITERKLAEEALHQSEQQTKNAYKLLQIVLDTIPVRLFWKDRNSVYLGCNRLFAQDAGFQEPEELIGSDDYSLGWNEQTEIYHRDDVAVMESGTPKLHYEEIHTTLDGKQIWLSMSKVPLRDAGDKIIGVMGTYEDVTRRKWLSEELLKIQKIESLGLLAGGIAHDFNNILMAIMGNISFAKMILSPTEEAYARLTVAETASLRAKTLTQQFLTFSSGGTPVKHSFSIAKMIKACGQFQTS